jgi:hypothetical protein
MDVVAQLSGCGGSVCGCGGSVEWMWWLSWCGCGGSVGWMWWLSCVDVVAQLGGCVYTTMSAGHYINTTKTYVSIKIAPVVMNNEIFISFQTLLICPRMQLEL